MELKRYEIYKKIWDMALPYQDKRNDKGHTEIALKYAFELLEKMTGGTVLLCNDGSTTTEIMDIAVAKVVIPAIILHDIGWSQMPEDKLLIAYNPPSKEAGYTARLEHQIYALSLAIDILNKSGYSVEYGPFSMGEIIKIISQHDTRQGFYSLPDAIVRDADKLWRYSQELFEIAAKNKNWKTVKEAEDFLELSKNEIDRSGFFLTGVARQIARQDLAKLVIPGWLK